MRFRYAAHDAEGKLPGIYPCALVYVCPRARVAQTFPPPPTAPEAFEDPVLVSAHQQVGVQRPPPAAPSAKPRARARCMLRCAIAIHYSSTLNRIRNALQFALSLSLLSQSSSPTHEIKGIVVTLSAATVQLASSMLMGLAN